MTAKTFVRPPHGAVVVMSLLVVALLLDHISITARAGDQATGVVSAAGEPLAQASPQALVSGAKPIGSGGGGEQINGAAPTTNNNQQNVILIKYANVTTSKQGDGGDGHDDDEASQRARRLNVFQLYNEPLSVPVIESRFSQSIELFDVSHNQLSTLSKDLFCPLSNEVRQLNISHNLLDNFDCLGLISQAGQLCLSELRVLDMSHNLIKHLPATGVATLQNLEILNLSHNLIESLDELSLSSLFKLIKLDLSFNRIQQLPMRVFHKSSAMEVLHLQSNQLQNIVNHSFLSGLISLQLLNLSFNNISHVSELAFLDKPNLTRVDLTHNHLTGLRQEALLITAASTQQQQQASSRSQVQPIYKPRLQHNGQYAGQVHQTTTTTTTTRQAIQAMTSVEFHLSSNPFVCDCQLEWMRTFQPAIKRSVLSGNRISQQQAHNNYHHHHPNQADPFEASSIYQNDQPPVSVIQQQQQSSFATAALNSASSSPSNSSENIQIISQQQPPSSQITSTSSITTMTNQQQPPSNGQNHYGRIADLDLIKCSPLFRRNSLLKQSHQQARHGHARAPSDGAHHNNLAAQVHHANNHLHHHHQSHLQQQHHSGKPDTQLTPSNSATLTQSNMIDLLTADSSNFLCRYKSHCFALCHCCEFDACDCEMICPSGCNCYYNLKWQTNIIDCSSNNHTSVPERIPMDVSGLYLDGNNIDSLKPSNLIARRSLKTLFLNSTNLQFIANRTFNGLIELQTLYLNDNQLRSLQGYEFEPLAALKSLYLQSNRLDRINNQTFIYLRSLELLDLSNNRLTSMNLDLFMFIGHHNIRLRQLSIAHNWWSCQCNSINSFRQILKQKFLVNGGVNIVDRNQLRCYYNSTTVGPLILDGSPSSSLSSSSSSVISQLSPSSQPIFGSFLPASARQRQQLSQQQQLLTEINQCSELLEDNKLGEESDMNPPILITQPPLPPPPSIELQPVPPHLNDPPEAPQPGELYPPVPDPMQQPDYSAYDQRLKGGPGGFMEGGASSPREHLPIRPPPPPATSSSSLPLASFIVVLVLFVCVLVVAISVFVFVRQQQQRYHNPHHKKSSAASTASISSSASSTALSTGAAQQRQDHHHHHHHHQHAIHQHGLAKFPHHDSHHPAHFEHNFQHGLVMGAGNHNQQQQQQHQHTLTSSGQIPAQPSRQHHQHSASSQSNIYATLVPSATNANSTTITSTNGKHQQQRSIFADSNLYSNHSTTASHLSSSGGSSSQHNGASYMTTNRTGASQWHQQPLYGSQMHNHLHHQQQQQQQQQQHAGQLYGQVSMDNPYAISASLASYKTGTSLYQGNSIEQSGGCQRQIGLIGAGSDWISLPKVKQLMSRLVNKSLALGGYRPSQSRDELSNIASDKIYDAFLSYDKRDEPFVQRLSAELEYGSPQYRVADRYRDLPLPSSAYIAEAITSVIGCSHRTIIVLSDNYLANDWCRYELQAALRETSIDKSHRVIVVVSDPRCLQELDTETRSLLAAANLVGAGQQSLAATSQQQQQQLVQLADTGSGGSPPTSDYLTSQQHQLVTTLTNLTGGNQQICTQTTGARVTFINYNERNFSTRIKQLMPVARPSSQTLTLTTKN